MAQQINIPITTLYGQAAIDYARMHDLMLSKMTDPIEGERIEDIPPAEAEQMIRDNLPAENLYAEIEVKDP